MDVREQADLQTTLDAYLFIIGATFKENSLNFLSVGGYWGNRTEVQKLPAQAIF
jgi:hypothetical protein